MEQRLDQPGPQSLFQPVFDLDRCDGCGECALQCTFNEIRIEPRGDRKIPTANRRSCGACHRCEVTCPRQAIYIEERPLALRRHGIWKSSDLKRVHQQSASGAVNLTGFGSETDLPSTGIAWFLMPAR